MGFLHDFTLYFMFSLNFSNETADSISDPDVGSPSLIFTEDGWQLLETERYSHTERCTTPRTISVPIPKPSVFLCIILKGKLVCPDAVAAQGGHLERLSPGTPFPRGTATWGRAEESVWQNLCSAGGDRKCSSAPVAAGCHTSVLMVNGFL